MQDERTVRLGKIEALKAAGMDPYPATAARDATCADVRTHFDTWAEEGKVVALAGRVMMTRVHGAMIFADLRDETGRLQFQLQVDRQGEASFNLFRDCIDPGDFVQVSGTLFRTKRGEETLAVNEWHVLCKALLPLPEKWHGLQDVETRYRERELDLIANEEVRNRFLVRSRLVSALRRFLDERGFLEVETPMLHPIPGGANAKPFVTHHNALDMDLYLRIAPELYLKRLVVGGFEKIYEIGRSFRNEGIDYAHNPEFTMMELYWAFAERKEFVAFLEDMVVAMVQSATGSTKAGDIDYTSPWKQTTFRQSIVDACGIDIDDFRDADALVGAVRVKGVNVDFAGCIGIGEHYDQLFKKTARVAMVQPTWVFDYPVELKPLAGRSPEDATKSASVQLVVQGAEIINAYYRELIDPVDQRERFEHQERMRLEGSEEAQQIDQAFLRALEHGMPPTCGMGLGVDRLVAFITESPNLKEVILFPTLRPEANV